MSKCNIASKGIQEHLEADFEIKWQILMMSKKESPCLCVDGIEYKNLSWVWG